MSTEVTERERTPSLYEIEKSLQMLMQDREETQDPEELAAIDAAITEYVAKEISKVDRIRGYIRYAESKAAAAKQAAAEATSYAQIWENRIRRIKGAALVAMDAVGAKRLEGTAGSLSARKNGGVQPLEITDASLLPDDCCRMEGWVRADWWAYVCRETGLTNDRFEMKRVPDNAAIRAKLMEDCPSCDGHGYFLVIGNPKCEACGGSGKNAVPGAHLAERGTSLVVR